MNGLQQQSKLFKEKFNKSIAKTKLFRKKIEFRVTKIKVA